MRAAAMSAMFAVLQSTVCASLAYCNVVYDSIDAEYNFGGRGLTAFAAVGETVRFSESKNVLSSFEIAIAGANPPPFDASVTLDIGLFSVDSTTDLPSSLLWHSGIQTFPMPARITQVLSFNLPEIVVGDSVAWGVLPTDVFRVPVLLSSQEVHVGTPVTSFQSFVAEEESLANVSWQKSFRFVNGYEVRFTTVPDPPSIIHVLTAGATLLLFSRRRVVQPVP